MHTLTQNARSLRLLAMLNADRFLMAAALVASLVAAAYLAQAF